MIANFFELLHMLDSELYEVIKLLGIYIYLLLFAVVFSKTGFVIFTFLPGDSLVFASGTLAAVNQLSFMLLFLLFFMATILGDSNNFLIGRIFSKIPAEKSLLLKFIPVHILEQARNFLNQYGKVAITFSRFIPLMRTMTPFIAGYTGYSYKNFMRYNVIGAFIWTGIWLGSGFALGNLHWVENNLFFTLSLITSIMFIPSIYGFTTKFLKNKKQENVPDNTLSKHD